MSTIHPAKAKQVHRRSHRDSRPHALHPQRADAFEASRAKKPRAPQSFAAPVDAGELPARGHGFRVVTFNAANGARPQFRTPHAREAQAALLHKTDASVIALQETDDGVNRSHNANTALEVAEHLNAAMRAFRNQCVAVTPIDAKHHGAGPQHLHGVDGVHVLDSGHGTLVRAESFSGDDHRIGGAGVSPAQRDTGADATFGNATYVAPPNRVSTAYVVALPRTSQELSHAERQRLAAIGQGGVSAAERHELAEANNARRAGSGDEPRSALVTRVVDAHGVETSVINVHLSHDVNIRRRQLEAIAAIAMAEGHGAPGRQVVVMGDFNAGREEVGPILERGGLRRAAGTPAGLHGRATLEDFDQVYVGATIQTESAGQIRTAGTTDHPVAGTATLIR